MGDDTRRIANCGASFPRLLSEEGTCAGRTVFQHRESARGRRGSARTNHRRCSAQRRTAEKAEMRAILEKVPPQAVFVTRPPSSYPENFCVVEVRQVIGRAETHADPILFRDFRHTTGLMVEGCFALE